MKTSTIRVVAAGAILLSTAAMAGTFSFVKTEVNNKGQTAYVYKFSCTNRAEGTFSVVAINEDAAKKLARDKVKVVCEE